MNVRTKKKEEKTAEGASCELIRCSGSLPRFSQFLQPRLFFVLFCFFAGATYHLKSVPHFFGLFVCLVVWAPLLTCNGRVLAVRTLSGCKGPVHKCPMLSGIVLFPAPTCARRRPVRQKERRKSGGNIRSRFCFSFVAAQRGKKRRI